MDNSELKYKRKYLKYKLKYVKLKNELDKSKLQEGSGFVDNMMNIAKNIPGTDIMMSQLQNQVGMMKMIPGPQRDMAIMLEKFMTPQNTEIFGKIMLSLVTHLADPRFYPMMAIIIKDISMLMGSVSTTNPILVMYNLNKTLGEMRTTFPNEFVLLKQFFVSNRHVIIPVLQKYNPMFVNDATYKFLVDFVFG